MPLPHALSEGTGALLDRGSAAAGQGLWHRCRVSFPADARGGRSDRRTICAMSATTGATTEAEQLLSRLIQFDTVNPPGNELAAQEYLAEPLSEAGFACELLGAEPGRPNLLARLRAADAPPAEEPMPAAGAP